MAVNFEDQAAQAAKNLSQLRYAAQGNTPQQQTNIGSRAQTSTPQSAPPQLNANRMNTQTQGLQQQGMGQAQAVNAAANNPQNNFASGGEVNPNPPSKLEIENSNFKPDAKSLAVLAKALEGSNAVTPEKGTGTAAPDSTSTEQMFKDYENPAYQAARSNLVEQQNNANPQKFASGGPVHETIKNMPLKDVIKLLASHPGLDGEGAGNGNSPMKTNDMLAGGAVAGQSDPDAMRTNVHTRPGKANSNHGNGILSMNRDAAGYATGGPISPSEVLTNNTGSVDENSISPKNVPNVKMAGGGSMEADSIVGYGPDGTPIVQNSNGTEQYGDVNQLLDRPESASTLGTGEDPTNAISTNAANIVAGPSPTGSTSASAPAPMAKGGATNPPPGSLSKEVADDVPARLSEGEFVFSADAVRFWGLQKLNAMMEFARTQLAAMADQGNIRSPGDGKNPDEKNPLLGTFMQDKNPNMNAYGNAGHEEPDGDEDSMVTGLLKECTGGANFSVGGTVGSGGGAATGGDPTVRDEMTDVIPNYQVPLSKVDKMAPRSEQGDDKNNTENNSPDNPKSKYEDSKDYVPYSSGDESNPRGIAGRPDNGGGNADNKSSVKAATGGGIGEEQFAKGGSVDRHDYGRSNLVSSHPKGGSPQFDFNRGGIVGTTMPNLAPKGNEGLIPSGIKLSTQGGAKGTGTENYGLKKLTIHAKKGGLIKDYNGAINADTHQSYEGA